jgi:hypothetical protein
MSPLVVLVCAIAVTGVRPAHAEDGRHGPYAAYENLVEVLADFSRHLRDDLYRFPPPVDVTGEDLFAVTLVRLQNFRTLHPDELPDVVAFAKAEALARLGSYGPSARAFASVGAMTSPLAAPAGERAGILTAMAEASEMPETAEDLERSLSRLRAKLVKWDGLIERTAETPYEALCRREEERIEQRLLALIIENRAWLEDGTDTAVRSAKFLITKHAESRNAPAHAMRLGDLYAELAQSYALEHAETDFSATEFNAHVGSALEVYARIASLDGLPEKPQAQGKLDALEAYRKAVLTGRP